MIALILSLSLSGPAWAGELERAEHTRVSEEMRKLAQRNAWAAVENSYAKLAALEEKGEVLTYDEQRLGYEAARSLGNITAARKRLEKALKVQESPEVVNGLAEIDANYGRVELTFDKRYAGARELVPKEPPFAPDQRASIAWTINKLSEGGDFTGLLPAGEYTVDGRSFTVNAGQDKVAKLNVVPGSATEQGAAVQLAYVGPRAQLGVAVTFAQDPAEGAEGQPGAFSGPGPRVGVGLEIGVTETFEVIAEVGYHGMFGDPAVEDIEGEPYAVSANAMHMGYGWLAAGLRFDDFWIAAGPIWSIGAGQVTATTDYCSFNACPEGVELPTAANYDAYSGTVMAAGGAASVSYAFVDIGSLRGAVSLEGGAQTDSFRLYPWVQAAFTVAPSGEAKPKKKAKTAGGT